MNKSELKQFIKDIIGEQSKIQKDVVMFVGCKTRGVVQRSSSDLNLCNDPDCKNCVDIQKFLTKKMIQRRLEDEIHARAIQTGFNCSLIVMHPNTWFDLVKEITGLDAMGFNTHSQSLGYKGIKILRSLDVAEGLFEIR